MDVFEAINTRRSIRKYTDKPVPPELVEKILAAAMNAPSAGNQQPWQFIVITDKNTLAKIPEVSPYAAMAKDAALAVLVCGDLGVEKIKGYWIEDCSAAVENLLLAAHGLSLGAVWTGIYPMQDRVEGFKKLMNLPENIIPFALIPVGYPAQESKAENRFKEERVHYDKW